MRYKFSTAHIAIVSASILLSTFLLALVSGTIFFSLRDSSAESASTSVDVIANVDTVLSITTNAPGTPPTLSIPISPVADEGFSKRDVVVTVSTNNPTGYTLKMNSQTTDTALIHESAYDTTPNPTPPTIPSTAFAYNAPNTLVSNSWGWNPGPASSNSTFAKIPPSNDSQTINTTVAPASASLTTLTFAAQIDFTQTTGVYTNTMVFTATANVVPPVLRIISISPTTNWNGGDIYLKGINFPLTTTGTSITVGGTPCASYRLISTTSAICVLPGKPTGSAYNVVMTSAVLGASNTDKTVTYDGANKGLMQTFSQNTCSNMPLGLAQIWTDARNNAVYRVKKMLDNKCWMIDNLAYGGGTSNGGTASYGDTHNLTFATACGSSNYNTATVNNCGAAASAWTNDLTINTNNHHFTTNNNTGSSQLDRVGNAIPNTTASFDESLSAPCTNNPTGSGVMSSVCISYLYHWCTAVGLDNTTTPTCSAVTDTSTNINNTPPNSTTNIAMTGVVGKPGGKGGESKGATSGIGNQAGVNSATSGTICPAGWRLPVGRVGAANTATSNLYNEWNILNESMYSLSLFTDTSSTTIHTGTGYYQNWHPAGSFSSVGSGYFYNSNGLTDQSTFGLYWGSSLISLSGSAVTALNTGSIGPGGSSSNKSNGLAVRCVL